VTSRNIRQCLCLIGDGQAVTIDTQDTASGPVILARARARVLNDSFWEKFTVLLVSRLGFGAECLDLLGLLVIEVGELISCFAIRPQQLVQLGVYGLSVAVFGSLNKERHQERGDDRNAVPAEVSGVKNQPKHGVKKHYADDPRTGQPCSSICEKLLELLSHIEETGPDVAGSSREHAACLLCGRNTFDPLPLFVAPTKIDLWSRSNPSPNRISIVVREERLMSSNPRGAKPWSEKNQLLG
jgi:hypothetical protein